MKTCVIILCVFLLGVPYIRCEEEGETEGDEAEGAAQPKVKLETEYVPEGCERKSGSGDRLIVHYTGKLQETGEVFDSSVSKDEPFSFTLGMAEVIKGWDAGMTNMCEGEKRKITIPPEYAYGDRQVGNIPPGSTLVFEVELLKIEEGYSMESYFNSLDLNKDGKLDRDEVKRYMIRMGSVMDEVGMVMERPGENNALVDKMMRVHDGDGDGYISPQEMVEAPGREAERMREDREEEERRKAREEAGEGEEPEEEPEEELGEDEEDYIIEENTNQTDTAAHTEL